MVSHIPGTRLRRDKCVSVRYAVDLPSATSAVLLQRTDRHGMVGYKATALQPSLGERHPERTPPYAADWPVQKPRASSPPGPGAPHPPSGLVVLGHRSRPAVVAASGGRHALSLRADARGGAGHDAGGCLSCAPRDPAGRCARSLTWGAAGVGGRAAGDGGGLGAGGTGAWGANKINIATMSVGRDASAWGPWRHHVGHVCAWSAGPSLPALWGWQRVQTIAPRRRGRRWWRRDARAWALACGRGSGTAPTP